MRLFQSADSNCRPLSVVMVDGKPNRATHPSMKARAADSALVPEIGMASSHRVNRSRSAGTSNLARMEGGRRGQCALHQIVHQAERLVVQIGLSFLVEGVNSCTSCQQDDLIIGGWEL